MSGNSSALKKIEARLNRDSRNSDKPPSSDSSLKKPEKKSKKSKRKKGAEKTIKGIGENSWSRHTLFP